MTVQKPSESEIEGIVDRLGLNLSDEEISNYTELVGNSLESYRTVDSYPDSDQYRPRENRNIMARREIGDELNAWTLRCSIPPTESGALSGKRVAVKDNLSIAGLEMTLGSEMFQEFIPNVDTPVVSRLLENGAEIVGKTNMDSMAMSSDGLTTAKGPIRNPHDTKYLAGGSSGGSAVVVATNEVDIALGTDQAGSIRVPASWTGVIGYKPTFGLVPYTASIGIVPSIDHIGPLGRDIQTVAKTLSVIAGPDPYDPRQPQNIPSTSYEDDLEIEAEELSIAKLEEGFDMPGSEEGVNENVEEGLDILAEAGARVDPVSLPAHTDGLDIHLASITEAFLAKVKGEGTPRGFPGWHNYQFSRYFSAVRRVNPEEFPPAVILTMLLGEYSSTKFKSKYYTKARNLRLELREWYDEILSEYDIIAMPTTPMTAQPYEPEKDFFEYFDDAWANLVNTSPFNITGHPALSIPSGKSNGLPVGMMLVGPHFSDDLVLSVGRLYEKLIDEPLVDDELEG